MSISFCQASSPAGQESPAKSPPFVAQVISSYRQLIIEVAPDERPSQVIHAVARATDTRPVQVYNALLRAGKLGRGGETGQDAPKQVELSPQSPVVADARPFAPARLLSLLAWWCCQLLAIPAYVEDAIRRHSLRPFPAPVARDISWLL